VIVASFMKTPVAIADRKMLPPGITVERRGASLGQSGQVSLAIFR
jgi:hypothetical protein